MAEDHALSMLKQEAKLLQEDLDGSGYGHTYDNEGLYKQLKRQQRYVATTVETIANTEKLLNEVKNSIRMYVFALEQQEEFDNRIVKDVVQS